MISVLGGAFLIRAFDVDRVWSNWAKPTPAGFIRIFTFVAGIILILASIQSGISSLDTSLTQNKEILNIITDKIIIGQFVAGGLPFLWMGVGSIFGGMLLSNWLSRSLRAISDSLRLIVLGALYPTVAQFTNMLVNDESSFTLIPPLLIGLAITLISATLLFHKYRKKKGGQILTE